MIDSGSLVLTQCLYLHQMAHCWLVSVLTYTLDGALLLVLTCSLDGALDVLSPMLLSFLHILMSSGELQTLLLSWSRCRDKSSMFCCHGNAPSQRSFCWHGNCLQGALFSLSLLCSDELCDDKDPPGTTFEPWGR